MRAAAFQERFQNLMEEHKKILYKVANSYCHNPDDRDDLAQEIIVQLWRSFRSFDGRVRFSTWMYRIALNVAISFCRRENVRSRHLVPDNERLLDVAAEAPAESDDVQALYQWIERLDALHRALALLYLDGNSYHEIAEILGISETNAATKISRLKQTLRKEAGVEHGTR
ncbi:MAG TPA: RNA polymerase sigma factor [Bryobacteraceae bacterium]|nr:RNA polymerase sigma factor [Bryobacteraceae bacterium]